MFDCKICQVQNSSALIARHYYSLRHVYEEFLHFMENNEINALKFDVYQTHILNLNFLLPTSPSGERSKCVACSMTRGKADVFEHIRTFEHQRKLYHRLNLIREQRLDPDSARTIICHICDEKIPEQKWYEHVKSKSHTDEESHASRFIEEIVEFSQKDICQQYSSTLDGVNRLVQDVQNLTSVSEKAREFSETTNEDIRSESSIPTETASRSCSAGTENMPQTTGQAPSRTGSAYTEFRSQEHAPTMAEDNFPSSEDFSITSEVSNQGDQVEVPAQGDLAEIVKRYLRTKVDNEKNQKLYICDLCKSETTGMQPFVQHIRGNAHKKKERAKRMSSGASFTGQLNQSPMRVPVQTTSTAIAQNGQNIAAFTPTVSRTSRSNLEGEFVSPVQVVQNQSPRGSQDRPLTELLRDLFVDSDSGYDLTNFSVRSESLAGSERNYGRCTTCGTEFFDASDVETHLKSDEHKEGLKNAMSEVRKPNVSGVLVCNICGSAASNRTPVPEFKDVNEFNAHLATDFHISNAKNDRGMSHFVPCITCDLSIRENGYYVHLRSTEHCLNLKIAIQIHPNIYESKMSGPNGVVVTDVTSSPHAPGSAGAQSSTNIDRNANSARGMSGVPESTRGENSEKAPPTVSGSSGISSVYRNYNRCDICNVDFTNVNMANDHYKGKKHQKKALSLDASDTSSSSTRDSLPASTDSKMVVGVLKSCTNIPDFETSEQREAYYEAKQILKSTPRYYQHDLFRRVMQDNYSYYCFLPTGLGKTLIACLIMSKMLELNPERQRVFFVTDKVLLNLQQMKYIRNELSAANSRHLKVAALCGEELKLEDGLELNQHHILLFTAEFLRVRLQRNLFKWNQVCCVVFDEVHHCDAKHPYRTLINEYHLPLVNAKKEHPKLIGLTASPAFDKAGNEKTLQTLKDRLRVFGRARLVTANQKELDEYRVLPDIRSEILSTSFNCSQFANEIGSVVDVYLENNLALFERSPKNISDACQFDRRKPTEDSWLYTMDFECQKFLPSLSNPRDPLLPALKFLMDLFEAIFLARFVSLYEAHFFLQGISEPGDFEIAVTETRVQRDIILEEFRERAEADRESEDTPFYSIKNEIAHTFAHSAKDKFLLILVTTRCFALSLTRVLSKDVLLSRLKLEVGCVVGHGSTNSQVRGMSVKKQNQALNDMLKKQIFVATSVAEEGIDVPGCEKVILLNAPKDTTAFVQIRGRARKKDSAVVFIGTAEEDSKLRNLISSEKYMLDAVQKLNNKVIM